MPRELRPLARALSLRRTVVGGRQAWDGTSGARRVVAVGIGVGPRAAADGTARVLDEIAVERVLVIGVAGACSPRLAVGDVVSPAVVLDAPSGAAYRPAGAAVDGRTATLVTVQRLGAAVPDDAVAVDMETAAIAAVCVARGVPWDARRAISDLPGTVPAAFGSLLREDGRTDLAAVARILARQPGEAARLVRLGRDASKAVAAVTAVALEEIAGGR
jgi:adenosylhomocysteine nucleosidase